MSDHNGSDHELRRPTELRMVPMNILKERLKAEIEMFKEEARGTKYEGMQKI